MSKKNGSGAMWTRNHFSNLLFWVNEIQWCDFYWFSLLLHMLEREFHWIVLFSYRQHYNIKFFMSWLAKLQPIYIKQVMEKLWLPLNLWFFQFWMHFMHLRSRHFLRWNWQHFGICYSIPYELWIFQQFMKIQPFTNAYRIGLHYEHHLP